MRIEYEIKLGFKDVMIRPKRSTLKSRSQVSLERNFTFVNSQKKWSGVPIIAANMDTVGTFEMAEALAKEKIITAQTLYSGRMECFSEQPARLDLRIHRVKHRNRESG
jgi:hypothetical protein